MNDKLYKGIEDIKEIRMTDAESKTMLASITAASVVIAPAPLGAIKSPWTIYSFRMWIEKKRKKISRKRRSKV